ncbi:MAG: GtrA family protein [Bacilli bacterium]|nr:GtrA family protein [Bacilli bacterium]
MKKLLKKYEEIIRYLIVGISTTIVSFSTYYLLTKFIFDPYNKIELQISNILTWIVAVTFAYFANRKYVFKKQDKPNFREAKDFYLARVLTLLIDMLIMYLGVSLLNYNDRIIKLIDQVVITILNYIFSKFIFKKTKKFNS